MPQVMEVDGGTPLLTVLGALGDLVVEADALGTGLFDPACSAGCALLDKLQALVVVLQVHPAVREEFDFRELSVCTVGKDAHATPLSLLWACCSKIWVRLG